MRKGILQFRFAQLREPVFLFAIGVSVFIALNQPTRINSPKNYKPVISTERITENPSVNYLTDSDFSRLYTLRSDVKDDTCIELTVEDAMRLMQISVLEDSTDAKSQALIMSVILNRVASPDFPNTIKEVIEQENQFSTSNAYKSAIPDANSHEALYLIESGQIQTDYLYFEATWIEDTWQSSHRELAETYGGTRYYR